MAALNQEHCEACNADAPKVSDDELASLMREIPEWTPVSDDGVMMLRREFKFKNFRQALEFTNKVGEIAEAEKHHPEIITEWGKAPGGPMQLMAYTKTILLWLRKRTKS